MNEGDDLASGLEQLVLDGSLTRDQMDTIMGHVDNLMELFEDQLFYFYDHEGLYLWSGSYAEPLYAYPKERMIGLKEPLLVAMGPHLFAGKRTPLEILQHFKWICDNLPPAD